MSEPDNNEQMNCWRYDCRLRSLMKSIKELEAALKETLPIITLHNGEMSERIGKLLKGRE